MRLPLLLAACMLAACTPRPANEAANAVANSIGEPAPAVTPAPVPSPEPVRSNVRYRCIDGSKIAVAYDGERATVSRGGKRLATLRRQRVASGVSYAAGGYELRGKGDDMDFTTPGLPPLPCTAIR